MTWGFVAGAAISGIGAAVSGNASRRAAEKQRRAAAGAAQQGIDVQQQIYGQARADNQPYLDAGGRGLNLLMQGIGDGTTGDLTRRFSMADFEKDPGYEFRMTEGQRGVEGSAAARGALLSGAALKALTRYNQNFASNEYGLADARFARDQNNRYGRLLGIAGIGENAVGRVGAAGQNYGNNVTNLLTGAGNAAGNAGAAATIGANNAMMGGVSNAYNMWQHNQLMQQMNQQPDGAVGGAGGLVSAPIYDASGNLEQAPVYDGRMRHYGRNPWTVS